MYMVVVLKIQELILGHQFMSIFKAETMHEKYENHQNLCFSLSRNYHHKLSGKEEWRQAFFKIQHFDKTVQEI